MTNSNDVDATPTVVVLAGGKGQRLMPLTRDVPKSMVRVHGKPVLEWILLHLKAQGFGEVTLSVSYLSKKIVDYFGDGSKIGIGVTYFDSPPTGTVGASKIGVGFERDNLLIIYGDTVSNMDYHDIYQRHLSSQAVCSVVVTSVNDASRIVRKYGIVEVDGDVITRFVEKPKSVNRVPCLVNTGTFVVKRDVLDRFKPEDDFSYDVFPKLIKDGTKLAAYFYDQYWWDIGTPEELLEANALPFGS